jgi:hypothetical protein
MIKDMFTDPRTWSTQLYFLMMLPLGTVYFTLAVTLVTVSLAFIAAPFAWFFGHFDIDIASYAHPSTPYLVPFLLPMGILLLFATLHLARGIGKLHAQLAKHLLVKSAQYG